MPDYSYECTKATILDDMGTTYSGDRMVFARMEFENEHGHPMETVEGVVVLREYGATIATDAEDILDPEISNEEWERQSKQHEERLLRGDVGFDIYNQEEIAEAIRLQLAVR